MPFGRERPDPLQMLQLLWPRVEPRSHPVGLVVSLMLLCCECNQVGRIIVEVVVIVVVNVVTFWDRSVVSHPDFFVKTLDSTLSIGDPWCVVAPIRLLFGIWVSAELDAVVDDDVDSFGHPQSISELCSVSKLVQPRPTTHTGWFPVPVSVFPFDNSTSKT